MSFKLLIGIFITAALCSSALALASTPIDPDPPLGNATFTFHENLHEGQKVRYSLSSDCKTKSTATTNGVPTVTDTDSAQSWKFTLTIQAEKDGSATQSLANVDPDSYDTNQTAGQDTVKTPCPFAGKTVTLNRNPDETFSDDSKVDASNPDVSLLDGFMTPDADIYPDTPVAVGDTWDSSDKLAKHSSLGPKDQLNAICRLDWVKTIDGKQVAQISCSEAIIYHVEGNLEEDQQSKSTSLVDLASGIVIRCDQTGSCKYSTPPTEPTQVTGGYDFTSNNHVLPDAPTQPATQP